MKTAILQVADTGPLESLVVMLNFAGYECVLPNDKLLGSLREIGCDTVQSVHDLVRSGSYDPPMPLNEVGPEAMTKAALYVDVKAHRNGAKVWRKWPNLKTKTLWYRINGSKPEHVITKDGRDMGDEVNPPCPVATPNQWYRTIDNAYAFWPPFVRFADYDSPRVAFNYEKPLCLVHNLAGWGYGPLAEPFRNLGVQIFGERSPDGLLPHKDVKTELSRAICMVHMKSNDAPGYALYEAMAAACPIICTRRLIWRCQMQDLLISGETCLVFDRETHDGLNGADVAECVREVGEHLQRIGNPIENKRFGEAGRQRLREIMWNEARDGVAFAEFMRTHFA